MYLNNHEKGLPRVSHSRFFGSFLLSYFGDDSYNYISCCFIMDAENSRSVLSKHNECLILVDDNWGGGVSWSAGGTGTCQLRVLFSKVAEIWVSL